MRRAAAFIGVVLLVVSSIGQPAIAAPSEAGPPDSIAEFTSTAPLDANQTTPDSLEGKIRIDEEYLNDTTVELVRDDPRNFTLSVNVTAENATNATLYIQTEAMKASQNITGLVAYLDGNETDFYVDEDAGPGQSPWVKVVIPHFSERTLTFEQTSDDIAAGPIQGRARNVVAFGDTTVLSEDQVQPDSLAGKIRVSTEYAAEMNVSLTENTSTETRLSMEHPNASNVSVYLQERAMASSQNMEQLQFYVNGEKREFGNTTENGSPWVNYNVEEFSENTVLFATDSGGGTIGGIDEGLLLIGGSILAVIVLVGLFLWRDSGSSPEYID